MRREFDDELLRSLLGFTSALREEVRDVRRMLAARNGETKYNPNWRTQPRAPRGVSEGGQWTGGGAAHSTARQIDQPAPSVSKPTARKLPSTPRAIFDLDVDTNGVPTPGWAEPNWEYPDQSLEASSELRVSPETELLIEAAYAAADVAEGLRYRGLFGRSDEDDYESFLLSQGTEYIRNVFVTTREGPRFYDLCVAVHWGGNLLR